MAASTLAIDASALQSIQGVAGHDGMLSSAAGELIVKPCTQAEIDFYETTLSSHRDFVQFMPVYMGTLTLGSPDGVIASDEPEVAADSVSKAQGKKIATGTAIVLQNLEHGFTRPNVIDIKLGARLYAPGTSQEKAARLDKVASETTSGSLNFRIAGMKVWNDIRQEYDVYDKLYGRGFNEETIHEAFETYFEDLLEAELMGAEVILFILNDITQLRHMLERKASRFYSASILIVYEGDAEAAMRRAFPPVRSRDAREAQYDAPSDMPKASEDKRQTGADGTEDEVYVAPDDYDLDDEYDEDEDGDGYDSDPTDTDPMWRCRMIDFAHSQWLPGAGPDENIIKGLRNIERHLRSITDSIDFD